MEASIMLVRRLLPLLEGPFTTPEDITLTGMSVLGFPSVFGVLTVVIDCDFFTVLSGVLF